MRKYKKKNTISACLIIYNEEKVIERCLKSIVNVVDEIIVVHDGPCSDKSLEICKKYGAKIFVREHSGSAEYHRPFAFKKAKSTWVLHIDADEFLGVKAQKRIPRLISNNSVDGYAFNWPIWVNATKKYIGRGPYSSMMRLCLYRKSRLVMLGITQYHPKCYGKTEKIIELKMHHRPKSTKYSLMEVRRKVVFWSRLSALQQLNYRSMPKYGDKEYLSFEYSIIEYELNHVFYHTLKSLFLRFGWFVRHGGLLTGWWSYRHLLFELSYIFFIGYYKFIGRLHEK